MKMSLKVSLNLDLNLLLPHHSQPSGSFIKWAG